MQNKFKQGDFIFAYYKDTRKFQVEEYRNIEKIQFRDKYSITDNPGTKLTKYLVDLKATQAFTKDNRKSEKIDKWFHKFENILKMIFDDVEITDRQDLFFTCDCSREKMINALSTIGKQELQSMIDEDHGCEITCQFCNTKYQFSEEELQNLINRL